MAFECDVCNSVFQGVEDLTRHEDLEHNVIEWFEEDLVEFVDTSAASDYHCTFTKRPSEPWPDASEPDSEACAYRNPDPENDPKIDLDPNPLATPKAKPETDSETDGVTNSDSDSDSDSDSEVDANKSDSETDSELNSVTNSSNNSSGNDSSDSSSDSDTDSETGSETDSPEDPVIVPHESATQKVLEPTEQLRPIVIDDDLNESGSTEGLNQSLDRLDSNIISDQRFHFTVETTSCQHCGGSFSCESSLKVHLDFSRCSGQTNPPDISRVGRKRPNLRQSTLSRRVDYAKLEGNNSDREERNSDQEERVGKRARLGNIPKKQRNGNSRKKGKENSFQVRCDECNGVFPCMSKLVRHVSQVHKSDRPFSCKVCGQGFKANNHLTRHEKLHLRPLIGCSQCSEQFATPWLLQRHVDAKHKVSKCDICVRVFKSGKELYQHNHTFHRKTLDGGHACKICGRPLSSKLLKEIHERTHSTDRPFSCNQCDKTFKHQRNLEGHKKTVHSEIRPFTCSFCGDAFKKKSHLDAHLRVAHTP